jgi:hypothetical protein
MVEYVLAATFDADRQRGSAPFIGVLRVRDCKITHWRE